MITVREIFYRESDYFIERVSGDDVGKVSEECEHVYM